MSDDFSGIHRSVYVDKTPWRLEGGVLTREGLEAAAKDALEAEYEPHYYHPVGRPNDGHWTWERKRKR